MPTRFCGVGAWRVRSNSAVFLRSRDRGSEDAVVFSEIGDDGYFDQTKPIDIDLLLKELEKVAQRVAPASSAPLLACTS